MGLTLEQVKYAWRCITDEPVVTAGIVLVVVGSTLVGVAVAALVILAK